MKLADFRAKARQKATEKNKNNENNQTARKCVDIFLELN